MIKVMFVCHGNICRSPMAEFVFRDMVAKKHLSHKILIASSATSREEIGNPVHPGTRHKLKEVGISCDGKYAIQLTKKEYEAYDYILCMDRNNIRNTMGIIKEDTAGKVFQLLDFSCRPGDIADPWYTGNFEDTYMDVVEGCNGFLEFLMEKENL